METADLQTAIADQLNKMVIKLTSPEWSIKIQALPPKQRQQAQKQFLQLQALRLKIQNAELDSIATKLSANEPAILANQKSIQTALDDFATAQSVMKAITTVLNTAARITSVG